jgi:hypothetical protein
MLSVGATNFPPPRRHPETAESLAKPSTPNEGSLHSADNATSPRIPRVARTLLSAAVDVALPPTDEEWTPLLFRPMWRGQSPPAILGKGMTSATPPRLLFRLRPRKGATSRSSSRISPTDKIGVDLSPLCEGCATANSSTDGHHCDFVKRMLCRRSPPVSSGYATTQAKRPLPLQFGQEVQTLLPTSRRESTYKVPTRGFAANSARQEQGAVGCDVRHIRHEASLEQVKDGMTDAQIREFYRFIADLWPINTNPQITMPPPDDSTLRAAVSR